MPGGWAATDMAGQEGRTALVTGANSGIGFQAAAELARHGAEVLGWRPRSPASPPRCRCCASRVRGRGRDPDLADMQ